MCGRYATTRSPADLSRLFEAIDETTGLKPRYNVAPTDSVPVVRTSPRGEGRLLSLARWGLLPHWAKDPRAGSRMINARAETLATSPAFATAYASRRALVPADGWYEWLALPGGGKQPYFITPADGAVLALAGLWSSWGPQRLLTFTVVTTESHGEIATIHDRMPLVLPPQRWQAWLEGPSPALEPPPADLVTGLELRPVGAAVGNVRNEGPELTRPVGLARGVHAPPPTLF